MKVKLIMSETEDRNGNTDGMKLYRVSTAKGTGFVWATNATDARSKYRAGYTLSNYDIGQISAMISSQL